MRDCVVWAFAHHFATLENAKKRDYTRWDAFHRIRALMDLLLLTAEERKEIRIRASLGLVSIPE